MPSESSALSKVFGTSQYNSCIHQILSLVRYHKIAIMSNKFYFASQNERVVCFFNCCREESEKAIVFKAQVVRY